MLNVLGFQFSGSSGSKAAGQSQHKSNSTERLNHQASKQGKRLSIYLSLSLLWQLKADLIGYDDEISWNASSVPRDRLSSKMDCFRTRAPTQKPTGSARERTHSHKHTSARSEARKFCCRCWLTKFFEWGTKNWVDNLYKHTKDLLCTINYDVYKKENENCGHCVEDE
jgi:hypothetical protein